MRVHQAVCHQTAHAYTWSFEAVYPRIRRDSEVQPRPLITNAIRQGPLLKTLRIYISVFNLVSTITSQPPKRKYFPCLPPSFPYTKALILGSVGPWWADST